MRFEEKINTFLIQTTAFIEVSRQKSDFLRLIWHLNTSWCNLITPCLICSFSSYPVDFNTVLDCVYPAGLAVKFGCTSQPVSVTLGGEKLLMYLLFFWWRNALRYKAELELSLHRPALMLDKVWFQCLVGLCWSTSEWSMTSFIVWQRSNSGKDNLVHPKYS